MKCCFIFHIALYLAKTSHFKLKLLLKIFTAMQSVCNYFKKINILSKPDL
jgi:hypothetical protein